MTIVIFMSEHKDTAPAEEAILFYAGWLGHYAGDGSQPLHTTINYNGWVQKGQSTQLHQ